MQWNKAAQPLIDEVNQQAQAGLAKCLAALSSGDNPNDRLTGLVTFVSSLPADIKRLDGNEALGYAVCMRLANIVVNTGDMVEWHAILRSVCYPSADDTDGWTLPRNTVDRLKHELTEFYRRFTGIG